VEACGQRLEAHDERVDLTACHVPPAVLVGMALAAKRLVVMRSVVLGAAQATNQRGEVRAELAEG
jgi:hypothetical protein